MNSSFFLLMEMGQTERVHQSIKLLFQATNLVFFFPNGISSPNLNRMCIFLLSAFSKPPQKPGKSPHAQSFPSFLQIFHHFQEAVINLQNTVQKSNFSSKSGASWLSQRPGFPIIQQPLRASWKLKGQDQVHVILKTSYLKSLLQVYR